ncbi:MAG: diguanylate cyclase [Ectothiorhodospiraceae bacterium]
MEKTFRAADVIARFGGDEFVVLLHNTSADQAPRVIERLEAALNCSDAHDTNNHQPAISLAHGVVAYDSQRYPTVDSLIKEADSRMYANKSRRR